MKKRTMTLFVLFALVTITSYAVSGTYAKYTYNFDTSDSARVAKWGVNKSFSIDLFKNSYIASDATATTETDVASKNGDKVVAPGTEGYYEFTLDLDDNIPETNYIIKFENITTDKTDEHGAVTIEATKDTIKDGAGKAKMKYYLKQVTGDLPKDTKLNVPTFKSIGFVNDVDGTAADGVDYTDDINTLVKYIQQKYNNNVYAANAVDDSKWVIGWKWDFNGSNDAESLSDTELGNKTTPDKVVLSLNVLIEQTELKAKVDRAQPIA